MMPKKVVNYLFIFCACCLLSCYEAEEGCLDSNATNYTVTADDPCANCCQYPSFAVKFAHRADSTTLTFGQDYVINDSDTFQFNYLSYYLSDFHIITDEGVEVGVTDTVTLVDEVGNEFVVEDNFNLIRTSAFRYTLGTIEYTGKISGVRFNIGIPSVSNHATVKDTNSTHILTMVGDSLFLGYDEGYTFQYLKISSDLLTDSTETYIISGDENLVEVTLDLDMEATRGSDIEVDIFASYLKWFEGVQLNTDTREEIIDKIRNNTANVFSTE